jgi:hypothetical protein
MTILVAVSWIRLFPALERVDRMNEIEPEPAQVVV